MRFQKLILILILVVAGFLRLWKINEVPVSMFGDELDVGYHAYSVLKTGRDYYGNFLPLHFHSIAEWRTPLYLYSAVPTVAIFGITPLGVRLPAAVFGILGILTIYCLIRLITNNWQLATATSAILALSPWHIQYSRAAFEVTELLFFLLFGLFLFFQSLKNGRLLWLSAAFFALLPWIYSTAKLFTPLLLIFLTLIWFKDLVKLPGKYLIYALVALAIIGSPIAVSTLFGGGSERFSYVSVFTDPTTEAEVGVSRQNDARVRGETGDGLRPTILDRAFHNKFVFWGKNIVNNYFQAFSTEFLFNRGDPNLRHSIEGVGMFYKVEFLPLIAGIVFFFTAKMNRGLKLLIAFWLLAGVIPSAITRDGGNHATRLIFILPPLTFLIAFGLVRATKLFTKSLSILLFTVYCLLFTISFIFYQHNFWFHNPWYSERWWHAGFREAIQSIKEVDSNYGKVVISTASEPPWIFFAAHYSYPPEKWHAEFPIGNDVDLPGFGKISHTGKFYFGTAEGGLYEWGQVLDNKTLYLVTEKEVKVNLIREPERTPVDLKLLKAIAYPSGEPAFYLFSGRE